MNMGPFAGFIKQVVARLVVVTKKHAGPYSEQGKIIIHRPACFHIIAVPGTAVIKRKHHILGGY